MSELKPTRLGEKKDVKLKASGSANDELVRGREVEVPQLTAQQAAPGPAAPPVLQVDFSPNYEVMSVLGQGGMGTVYKVFDKALKTVFAIKVLRSEFSHDVFTLKRFQQEANAASKLTHPNLATVYDQGITTSGAPYLVMGYIEGKGLDKILKEEHRLDATRAIDLFLQIADSVHYAHEHGVIHRDLKPSNILPVNQARETQNLTGTGEVFGSPSYMSPEQGMGYNLEAKSDIYSFGCVMYEVLTGRVPFEASNHIQTIVQHLSEKPPAMQTQFYGKNGVPKALEQVVLKCLEKDPANRYQSMRELHEELQRVQSGKKINARAAKEDPLLTRSMLLKISLGVIFNLLMLTLTVGQYDDCIKEKIRAQSLISSANAVSKLIYDGGIALGIYSATKNQLFKERYLLIKDVIPEEIDSLRRFSAIGANDGGRESPAFKRIEQDAQTSIKILDETMAATEAGTIDQGPNKNRHMYKDIRALADDLQIQLRTLTQNAHKLSTDKAFDNRVKSTLFGELLLLFLADVLLIIRIMREVQRTAKKRVWKLKQQK
jgi:hypothetical protein